MGVSNLAQFMSVLGCKPGTDYQPFDCLLVDIQSIIYSKLVTCVRVSEEDIMHEVCESVFEWFMVLLRWAIEEREQNRLTVVVSFDGTGLPMKWPLQRKRRSGSSSSLSSPLTTTTTLLESQIDIMKMAIFECNSITLAVFEYFEDQLAKMETCPFMVQSADFHFTFVLDSCRNPGEGEHKLFKYATRHGFRKPLVFSIDNDVFLIALARRQQYDHVQIVKKLPYVYNLDRLDSYDQGALFSMTLMFGNDFIPAVLTLTDSNVDAFRDILRAGDLPGQLPGVVYQTVQKMLTLKKIRFARVDYYPEELLVEFWKNCLWVRDYYTKSADYPQKYMTNLFYDRFDRNHVLSAFTDFNFMKETFSRAQEEYKAMNSSKSKPVFELSFLFSEEQVDKIKKYLLPATTTLEEKHVIVLEWRRQG